MRITALLCLLALAACKKSATPDTTQPAPAGGDAVAVEVHMPGGDGAPSGPPQRSSGWPERLSSVDDCVVIAGNRDDFRVVVQGAVTSYPKEKARDVIAGVRRANRNVRVLIVPEYEPTEPLRPGAAIDEVLHQAKTAPVAYSVVHARDFIAHTVPNSELGSRAAKLCTDAYANADECGLVVLDGRSVRMVHGRQITAGQPPAQLLALLAAHPEVKRFVVAPYNMPDAQLAEAYPDVWQAARAAKRQFGDYREVAGEVPPSSDPDRLLTEAQSACFDASMDSFIDCPTGVVHYGAEDASGVTQLTEACSAVNLAPPDAVLPLGLKGCAHDAACTTTCAKAYSSGEAPESVVPACADAQALLERMPGASRAEVLQCHLAGWFAAAQFPASLVGDARAKAEAACRDASLIVQIAPRHVDPFSIEFGAPFVAD